MDNYSFTRWRKFGHDRVYVADASGAKLGHIDVNSGSFLLEDSAHAVAVQSAANAWCAKNGIELGAASLPTHAPAPAPAPAPVPAPVPEVAPAAVAAPVAQSRPVLPSEPATETPAWTDLSAHRPGEGVRQLAEEEWAAAKSRSRVISTLNRYVFDNHTDERAWRKGAEGEEYVGTKLNRLREKGWHVLHSVPVGKGDSDIDHIAIGPGGVFTVNSKNHASKKIWVAKYQMRVNGRPVPYLRNSRHEAARAKRLLETQVNFEVPVTGCVVVLTGSLVPEVTYRDRPDDVRVLTKWDVPRWFRKRKAALSPEQVEQVFEVARRSDTWRT